MLAAAYLVLCVLAALVIAATALPLVRRPYWWVRMFDFPRVQIAALAVGVSALLATLAVVKGRYSGLDGVLLALLGVATFYQVARILPYTRLWRRQVVPAREGLPRAQRLRLLVSNVRMDNRDDARWLAVVRAADADVVLAVETDAWWAERLAPLKADYPHAVEVPQDDTYGLCVYSRLPLEDVRVEHLVEPDVPSLFGALRLPSGARVCFVFLHPRPPRPDLQQGSHLRDAELVRAARRVAEMERPVVVAGDLNDVAWSSTTRLFQRLSGLLDPRIGRGLYATFHADHAWLRYPLDHVFHSDELALGHLERLGHVGSDHFPILIELALDDVRARGQNAPAADADDRGRAAEAVEDARAFLADETDEERAERKKADV
ncbi:MAG: endonuclease/exonuclease/phosphatase family protein [Rubricoccaceae bacterium]